MTRILRLTSDVADQIAAGEVVERPASVVKELVENALDAGATSIDVAIEEGGRALIRVADDGTGMERDDAVLALERHATSKIRTASDLVGVASFGFRGEALPAIASVSQLELVTAPGDGAGTIVRAAAGAVLDVADAARRRGTTVTVTRLFYNVPARQKFLRAARSEWRSVTETFTTIALARRDVRFTLSHDGKQSLALSPAPSLRARLGALWGARHADAFLDVDDVHGPVHVAGLVERPGDVGTSTRRVFLTVNGRVVRDAGLVRAAEQAYRSTLPSGLRPAVLLDVTVPADAVDVNVHPAKAEVRFHDRWNVERSVEHAVRRALGTVDSAASVGVRNWTVGGGLGVTPVAVDVEMLQPGSERGPLFVDAGALAREAGDSSGGTQSASPSSGSAPVSAPPVAVPPLLQLRRTYLMFEREEGVVLIDQHSAHERVLYERFMTMLASGAAPAQRLLFPLTLHLGPAQGEAFEANQDTFERLGFEVEGFGGHTLIVRSVPMPHARFDAERCLRESLDAITGDRVAGSATRHERLAATVACKAAIKAGDALSSGEMRSLFIDLAATTLPAHDVHGRSTIVHLSWDELERRFGRR